MAPSYSDVFNLRHERDAPEEILPGDLVRMGANHFPHYAVIAVAGDKAWVRNVVSGEDSLALILRCRKVAPDAPAQAAE